MIYNKIKSENQELKRLLEIEREKVERLTAQLSGERKCGEYCHTCKHRFVKNAPMVPTTVYGCLLNCDCKDFEKAQ